MHINAWLARESNPDPQAWQPVKLLLRHRACLVATYSRITSHNWSPSWKRMNKYHVHYRQIPNRYHFFILESLQYYITLAETFVLFFYTVRCVTSKIKLKYFSTCIQTQSVYDMQNCNLQNCSSRIPIENKAELLIFITQTTSEACYHFKCGIFSSKLK